MKTYLLLLGSSLFSALLAVGLYRAWLPPTTIVMQEPTPRSSQLAGWQSAEGEEDPEPVFKGAVDFTETARRVTPAVVFIKATRGNQFHRFLPVDAPASTGSGVIISANGFIVTNQHVIEGGDRIEVTLHDQREYQARVIGVDRSTDLALLRIDAEDLNYLRFANSDSLQVGEWVVAVGNPFNLESTVTAGIVSAKGRSINILDHQYRVESFIQTDAVVNPGNSGGALVNHRGGLVGINTAIVTRSGKYEGYSFAIPANLALKVVRDLREFGKVQRGILGVHVENLDQKNAAATGLQPGDGVLITHVSPGSAAFDAGLRKGDIVWSIEQQRVRSVPQLQEQVARYRPGQELSVRYIRKGQPIETALTLKEIEETPTVASQEQESILSETGMELRELTPGELRIYGTSGAIVQSVMKGSPADRVNIESGFIIRSINGRRVRDFQQALQLLENRGPLVLEGRYLNFPGEFKYIFP